MIAGPIRERAELCLSRLLAQTAIEDMEIIVVDLAAGPPLQGAGHELVRYVRLPETTSYSVGQAECARQAKGEIIAYIEDHCYPSPGWAASILKAFEDETVSIVAYGFLNYNPGKYLARAFFLTEYGRWACPAKPGPIPIPSCNNVAYRRADLDPFLPELDALFDAEFVMQRRILAKGGKAWLEPSAQAAHENWESLDSGLFCNHSHRRMNAARRAEASGWNLAQRVFFAGAMTVTPLLHLGRLAFALRNRPSLWLPYIAALPVSTLIYSATAYAEIEGFLFGPGSSHKGFLAAELGAQRAARESRSGEGAD